MTEQYFYSLTPRVFNNILVGSRRKQEREFKEEWERTRAIVVGGLMPHLGKNNKTPAELYPLPWDADKGPSYKKEDARVLVERSKRRWAEVDKKLNRDVE